MRTAARACEDPESMRPHTPLPSDAATGTIARTHARAELETTENKMGDNVGGPRGPRCIALVGPFQSGKTTLLEAILARTGAISRQGSANAGTSVGDASKEAREHRMSVEITVASTSFMGDAYVFIDCPGSVEFAHDMRTALPAVDAAIVVCEADEKKTPQLQLLLREIEELKIPHFLFLNKIDK